MNIYEFSNILNKIIIGLVIFGAILTIYELINGIFFGLGYAIIFVCWIISVIMMLYWRSKT